VALASPGTVDPFGAESVAVVAPVGTSAADVAPSIEDPGVGFELELLPSDEDSADEYFPIDALDAADALAGGAADSGHPRAGFDEELVIDLVSDEEECHDVSSALVLSHDVSPALAMVGDSWRSVPLVLKKLVQELNAMFEIESSWPLWTQTCTDADLRASGAYRPGLTRMRMMTCDGPGSVVEFHLGR